MSLVVLLLVASALTIRANLLPAQAALQMPSLTEELVIGPWNTVQVTRTIRMINSGSTTVSSATVEIPIDSSSVTVFDDMGTVASTVKQVNETMSVAVTLRYPLRGTVANTTYNDACTFSVRFTRPFAAYVSQPSFGEFRLAYNVSAGLSASVPEYTLRVVLPEGSVVSSSQPDGQSGASGTNPSVSFTFTNIESVGHPLVLVSYSYSPLWSAFRPTLFIGAIVAVLGGAILLRRRRATSARAEAPEVRADAKLLNGYADSLEDELGLWADVEDLEESLDSGSLGRKDYNRRKRILDERARTMPGTLARLSQSMRDVSPGYALLADRVQVAEKEVAEIRSGLSRSRAQFRAGRLSKNAFETQEDNYKRMMDKAKSTIESVIVEVRGELS
jgi:hypothetical protein